MPIDLRVANEFVRKHHRHSKPVRGQKFGVAVTDGKGWRGVAIAGRPVARHLDDGLTIEIYRVCTDGARNACSKLYAACCNAAKGMGYSLAITYTLASERGSSLRASGFKAVADVEEAQWGRTTRPRVDRELVGDKVRWERAL